MKNSAFDFGSESLALCSEEIFFVTLEVHELKKNHENSHFLTSLSFTQDVKNLPARYLKTGKV